MKPSIPLWIETWFLIQPQSQKLSAILQLLNSAFLQSEDRLLVQGEEAIAPEQPNDGSHCKIRAERNFGGALALSQGDRRNPEGRPEK
jgi:hypothetical protein